MAIFREPIAASLRLAGYDTKCAADGIEALQMTRESHPDLILLDVSMPKMDGMAFLKCLRADPTIAGTRVIMLTARTEKKQVVVAASFGVRDYLLKSRFGLADLLDRIKRSHNRTSNEQNAATPATSVVPKTKAAPAARPDAEVTQLMNRDQFLERVEHAFQGKTLSGVVAQVISAASSPRSDVTDLACLIARDPMLSARVLQAANSASYCTATGAVTTIADAIRKVGCTVVRNIAAALGVFDCMPDAGSDGFNAIRYWQHSFAVAQLCERLTAINAPEQSGLAYMIGLCHDLGDIFIRTQFSKEYQKFIEAAELTGRPREQLLGEMFGITAAKMVGAVLKCMALPDPIREPIEILHAERGGLTTNRLAQILWMAENYANAAMLASSPNSRLAPFTKAFCSVAFGDQRPAPPDAQTLRSEVLSMTIGLARLSRAEEAKLLVPMFQTSKANLWVARAPGVSDFDPVGLALKSLAKTVIEGRLPAKDETQELDRLVVVAPSPDTSGFSRQEIENLVADFDKSGRSLPVLAIACMDERTGQRAGTVPWRTTMDLQELAAFVEM